MANRFIKDSIWTSPNLNELSQMAELHFYRLLPLPDDHGCCELSADVVKGRCYPKRKQVTEAQIEKWNKELEDQDLIRTWEEKGRLYAWFPTWESHQRIRSLNKRKTPEPPTSVVNRRQPSSDDRSIPSSLSSIPSSLSFISASAENQKQEKEVSKPKKAVVTVETFEVSEALKKWVSDKYPSVDVELETQKFLDHHRSRGNNFKDWDAAWRTWVRNSLQFARHGPAPPLSQNDDLKFERVKKRLEARGVI